MGRNGEADLDKTLPRGELSIFAATRWDMRVLLSAVGHLTSTIIAARIGQRYDFWKDSLAFGKPTHNRNLQFTSHPVPDFEGTSQARSVRYAPLRYNRLSLCQTRTKSSSANVSFCFRPTTATRWSSSAAKAFFSTIWTANAILFRSRSGRECAGPCASANRDGNPLSGRESNSPSEYLL